MWLKVGISAVGVLVALYARRRMLRGGNFDVWFWAMTGGLAVLWTGVLLLCLDVMRVYRL